MMKRAFWILPFVATLALAGCSAPSSPATQSQANQPSQEAAPAAAPTQELTADQVKSVVEKLVSGDETAQIIDDKIMHPQLEMAKDMDSSGGITPKQCADLQQKYSVTDLTASVAASATTQSDSIGKVIQVFSITNEKTLKNISEALKLKDLGQCDTVNVMVSGQEISTNRQILKLDSTAEQALTMATQMAIGPEQYLNSVAVQGLSGKNFVLVTLSSGTVEAPLLAGDAMRLLDQAFAEISSL